VSEIEIPDETRRIALARDAAAVELATKDVGRRWLPGLDDLGRRMDDVEDRIDGIVSRLLPSEGKG
jgi:hypothetical protein